MSVADRRFMARALELARRGRFSAHPNPRVGSVIVRDGQVVGEGWHRRAGEPHAEIHALQAAGERARGATVYVNLEPCSHQGRTPPCAEALVAAGVSRVVVAMEDPNPRVCGQGLARLRAAGVQVEVGLLADEATALNQGFVKRMAQGRPLVRGKSAMSLDGRTAMASGESQWITGDEARRDVQRWRARSDAILTGIGTVLADDPSLNVRLSAAELAGVEPVFQPLRVVLDPELDLPPEARLLHLPGKTLVFTASDGGERSQALEAVGAEIEPVARAGAGLDLAAVLEALARREINEVLVESGPTLAGALLQGRLADEWLVYLAPHVMGDAGRGLFHLPGLERMEQRLALQVREVRAVGRDWRFTVVPGPG